MSTDVVVQKKSKVKVTKPNKWQVILLNDNVTTVEFVVDLLCTVFRHSTESALVITNEVHNSGIGVAGVYEHDIAEAKAFEGAAKAKSSGYPLQIKLSEIK